MYGSPIGYDKIEEGKVQARKPEKCEINWPTVICSFFWLGLLCAFTWFLCYVVTGWFTEGN